MCQIPPPTDEEDGEGDEEQEDMGNQVESVHEAAIVQHAHLHAVGIDTLVVAAKRQGHATTRLLHTSLESICDNKTTREEKLEITNQNPISRLFQDAKICESELLYNVLFLHDP